LFRAKKKYKPPLASVALQRKQRKQRSVIFKITEPEHYVFWEKNFAAKLCCGAVFSNPLLDTRKYLGYFPKINTTCLFKFCKPSLQSPLGCENYVF